MKKVFVGLSGGVDSSVSAALLKDAGFDVTGVFIKVWHPEWLQCDSKQERRDAMRVAAKLDIPFLTFDLEQEYKQGVADYMIEEYKMGRTPNPDVMCNKEVKFGAFLDKSLEMGADFIATGHYAQNVDGNLIAGADDEKDQTYFLWTLKPEQMKRVLFPVGKYQKNRVRKLAKKYGLPTASKKDSQGVCFLGKLDMADFLKHYVDSERGNVLSENGEIIGTHDGAIFYTIGQRHGFTISEKGTDEKALYVVSKDVSKNTITVASKTENKTPFETKKCELSNINWITGNPPEKTDLSARVRYRQKLQKCSVNGSVVTFDDAQIGAVGQSVVFYDGSTCLGGGVIEKVI